MNRIDDLFARKKKDVLAVYFTAGYPKLNDTATIFNELIRNKVDLIEIGMPFSDPLADGPVIQESSRIALENGMSLHTLFEQMSDSKFNIQNAVTPVVLMGYLNPVLQFGVEKFLDECKKYGVSGVILPDLPLEVYEKEYKALFEESGVHFIFLITPRTEAKRILKIASLSKGFIYLVSTAATTGSHGKFSIEQEVALAAVRKLVPDVPLLTGFGIHDHESRRAVTRSTNGAVVGSALIRELTSGNPIASSVKKVIDKLNTPSYDHSTN